MPLLPTPMPPAFVQQQDSKAVGGDAASLLRRGRIRGGRRTDAGVVIEASNLPLMTPGAPPFGAAPPPVNTMMLPPPLPPLTPPPPSDFRMAKCPEGPPCNCYCHCPAPPKWKSG